MPARLQPAGVVDGIAHWQCRPRLRVGGRTLFTLLGTRLEAGGGVVRAFPGASVWTTACAQAAHKRRCPAALATAVGKVARHRKCIKPCVQPVHATRCADGNLQLFQQAPTQTTHCDLLAEEGNIPA